MKFAQFLPYPVGAACFVAGWLFHDSPGENPGARLATKSRTMGPLEANGSAGIAEWSGQLEKTDERDLKKTAGDLLRDSHRDDLALWAPLLARWSAADGPGMIAFIEKECSHSLRPRLLDYAWFAWGASDPEAAFKAAGKLPPSLMQTLLKGVAEVNPRKAGAFAMRVPDSQFATWGIADQIVKAAPDLAEEFLSRAVYDGARKSFQRAEVAQLAVSDPAAAIAYARSCGVIGSDPVPEAVREIAKHDPLAAAAQVDAMTSSRSRSLSAVALAETWAAQDPDAAVKWIRENLNGPTFEFALVAAAGASGGRDPARALDLVLEVPWNPGADFHSIRDGGSMTPSEATHRPDPQSTAISLFDQFSRTSPDAARRYLQERVPDGIRQQIAAAIGMTL